MDAERKTLALVVVEDDPRDAELLICELEEAGYALKWTRVETEADYLAALDSAPDIILSDFALPHFDGRRALALLRQRNLDIPFIVVSGTIGEERAVEAIRQGASDYLLKDRLGRLGAAVGAALEQTRLRAERQQAQLKLRETQQLLSALADHSPALIFIKDLAGRYLHVNHQFEQAFGLATGGALGKTDAELFAPALAAQYVANDRSVIATGKSAEFEETADYVDGRHINIVIKFPLRDAGGSVVGIGGIVTDITERKREEGLYRATFNQSAAGIAHTSTSGRFVRVNQAFCDLLGYSGDELLALSFKDVTHPDDLGRTEDIRQALLADRLEPKSSLWEKRYCRKDGGVIWVAISASLVRTSPEGKPDYFVAIATDITVRKNLEIEMLATRDQLRATLDAVPDPLFELSLDGRYHDYHSPRTDLLAAPPEALLQSKVSEVLPPVAANVILAALREAHDKGWSTGSQFELALPQGRLWFELSVSRKAVTTGADPRFICLSRDVTDRRLAELRIQRLNRVYAVLSGINSLIVRVKDRDELFRGACQLAIDTGQFRMAWIGLLDRDSGIVRPIAAAGDVGDFLDQASLAVPESEPEARGPVGKAVCGLQPVALNDVQNDLRPLMRKGLDERGIKSLAILPLIAGGEGIGVVALYASEIGVFDEEEMRLLEELAGDISFALDHLEKAKQIDYLSYYDSLTGFANRRLFHQRLEQQLLSAARDQRKLALIILDIERFRGINDSLGRQAGDVLLQQVAERMSEHARDTTWLARTGADQFAIFVPDVGSEDELRRRSDQRLRQVFGAAFRVADTELRISAKMGIAMFPNDAADADALFGNAEAALRKSKQRGERFLFFEQRMTERVSENLRLENQLRQAIDKEEFVLHYQPKVDPKSCRIVGAEALIRWQSPELGLVPPGKFIPLMEETGLILEVGTWAIERAARDHRVWVEGGLQPPRIAVNVSSVQLQQRDFVEVIERAISQGVVPTGIDLEITESMIMTDVEANIAKLDAVRALGIQIAIDDFGTGYSSMAYLAKLPVHALKIDRSFIITMLKDPDTMTLVSTMISLAHSLRLKVVAEGVDDEEQAKILRLLRCDEMQGYLYSRPVPAEQLMQMLLASRDNERPGSRRTSETLYRLQMP